MLVRDVVTQPGIGKRGTLLLYFIDEETEGQECGGGLLESQNPRLPSPAPWVTGSGA